MFCGAAGPGRDLVVQRGNGPRLALQVDGVERRDGLSMEDAHHTSTYMTSGTPCGIGIGTGVIVE